MDLRSEAPKARCKNQHKEYYFKKSGSITGREFALFFMAMDRNEDW